MKTPSASTPANQKNNELNTSPIGVIPKPHPKQPPKRVFERKSYDFIDGSHTLRLPVRPNNLSKNDEASFRNVIKQEAIDCESKNDSYIIAYHRGANWWQIGGNSLLFYKYNLENEYGLPEINPRRDNDYGCKWPNHGDCAMIRDIKRFTENLTTKAKSRLILDTPELRIFQLPRRYDTLTISAFQNIRIDKQNRINQLLTPKNVSPHTRQSINTFATSIHNFVCKLTEPQRKTYGYRGAQIVDKLTYGFIAMSRNQLDPIKFFQDAQLTMEQMFCWLANAQIYGKLTVDELYRLTTEASDVAERIKNELAILCAKAQDTPEPPQ